MEPWSDQGKRIGGEVPGVVCTEEVVLEVEVMAGEVQEEEVLWRWGEQQGDQGLAEVAEEVKVEEEELAEVAILGNLAMTVASIHSPVKLSRLNASNCKN